MSWLAAPRRRCCAVDGIVVAYTLWTGLLIFWFRAEVDGWVGLVSIHAVIIVALWIIPPRGSSWEVTPLAFLWQRALREWARFLRYAYVLPLALFFFEEGRFTVNMIFPATPYWFESTLFAADAAVFGDLPARLMIPWVNPLTTEVMYLFYWSYYIILIGGVIVAYVGSPRRQRGLETPAPGFDTVITSLAAGFIFAFVFYPWLAARGPWEDPLLMAGLPPLDGGVFTWMVNRIIEHGAVSGNCFPSGHVAGAWAIVFGLAWTPGHRRVAWIFAFLSAGMTVACVYTRYHHAVDMPAGLAAGAAGGLLAGWLTARVGEPDSDG